MKTDTTRASSSTSTTTARSRPTKPRTSCPGCGEIHEGWSSQAWCVLERPSTLSGDGPFALESRCRRYSRGPKRGLPRRHVYLFPSLAEAEELLEEWRRRGCCSTCKGCMSILTGWNHRIEFLPGLFELAAVKLARLQAAQDGAPSIQAYDEPEGDSWSDTGLRVGYALPSGHRLTEDALGQVLALAEEIGSDRDQCKPDRGELLIPFDHMGKALQVLELAIYDTEPMPTS